MRRSPGTRVDEPIELEITRMRRRHLKGVMSIERKVYPRPWSPNLFLSEMSELRNRAYLVATVGREVVASAGVRCYGDETALAVVDDGRTVLANLISSQAHLHERFGGVVPEVASRAHLENLNPLLDLALRESSTKLKEIDAVAVTVGPGLVGALLVGIAAAKALAFALDVPLIGVHHLEGHIYANVLAHGPIAPPFVAFLVSGGHTMLVHTPEPFRYRILGQTLDDAAG